MPLMKMCKLILGLALGLALLCGAQAWAKRGRWVSQTFTTSGTTENGTRVVATQFVHVASTFLIYNGGSDYVRFGTDTNALNFTIAPTNGFTLPVVPDTMYDLYDFYFRSASASQPVRFMYPIQTE